MLLKTYDPSTDSWTSGPSLFSETSWPSVFSNGNKIFVAIGTELKSLILETRNGVIEDKIFVLGSLLSPLKILIGGNLGRSSG